MIMKKEWLIYQLFILFCIIVFIFLILDLASSALNVCQEIEGRTYCKFIPVIDLLPSLPKM